MKKVLIVFILIVGFALTNKLQAQKTKFYYYPSSNVYYNTTSGKYIYSNNGNWTTVNKLPARFAIARTPGVIVYNSSPEVWNNNRTHITKYKAIKMKSVPPGQLKARAKKHQ
jgi:hypothetical protein